MKNLILLAVFCSVVVYTGAQTRYVFNNGKVVTDGLIQGSTENENCLRLFVWKAGEYTVYKPDTIKEYHIGKRKSYYSMPIVLPDTTFTRFTRKIVDGDSKLYCYYSGQYNIFIVQNADTTVQLNKKTFKQELSQALTACPEKTEAIISHLEYDRHHLKKFVRQYNNNCRFAPLNLKRFGVLAGANTVHSITPSYYFPDTIGERTNLNLGIFVEAPINAGNFSFHGELYYSGKQVKKSKEILYNDAEEDFPVAADTLLYSSFFRQQALNMPLMLRYYLPTHYVRPFVNAGILLSLNLTENTYQTYQPVRPSENGPLTYVVFDNVAYSRLQPSFILGAGLAFRLDNTRMAYLECRYSKVSDLEAEGYSATRLSVLASVSF